MAIFYYNYIFKKVRIVKENKVKNNSINSKYYSGI